MRVVIQRVLKASCTVDGTITGAIDQGLCLFVGFAKEDDASILEKVVRKIVNLRIFSDEEGKMNLSVLAVGGKILSISQFTLYASLAKGTRPGFSNAARADQAKALYEQFNELLGRQVDVQTGIFQADMKINLVNDGPVTILLDSAEL